MNKRRRNETTYYVVLKTSPYHYTKQWCADGNMMYAFKFFIQYAEHSHDCANLAGSSTISSKAEVDLFSVCACSFFYIWYEQKLFKISLMLCRASASLA